MEMDTANIMLRNSQDLNEVYHEKFPERHTIDSGEMSKRQSLGKRFVMANEPSKNNKDINNRATGKFEDEDSLNLPMEEY